MLGFLPIGATVHNPVMMESAFKQDLTRPVRYLKGVGEARARQLERLDVETVGDLLLLSPARYEDRRTFSTVTQFISGAQVTVKGIIAACGWVQVRRGRSFFEAALKDGTGLVLCRWYNAAYLQDQLKQGDELIVYGKVSKSKGNWILRHPEFERSGEAEEEGSEESLHMGRVVPVYPLTENLPQRTLRRILWNAVQHFVDAAPEALPGELLQRLQLPGLVEAIRSLHFPDNLEQAERARYRLVFEEFLCIQLILVARKIQAERFLEGTAHVAAGALRGELIESLPFALTTAQERVLEEIRTDMARPHPMHRLLQGDVGSGKTVVAACAILDAIESGSQAAVMTSTEILATQHIRTLGAYLRALNVRMVLLKSEMPDSEKREALAGIKSGRYALIIGTHAIIQEKVAFDRLGLVVIDEQHKFGVEQRGALYGKGKRPDVLVMTATPIPRTLAMTLYGDLDVSVIDKMPGGRKEIVTRVIKEDQLPDAYGFIRKQVAKGRQAFFVYPLVSASETLELRSATEMYERLQHGAFKGVRLGLLHGQMPARDKDKIMQRFRDRELDILITTTVVEVGVDVPNANVMLVENAERFGLAQLHQLRGRIGRGDHKSFCILQGKPGTLDAWKRLKVMERTRDGFKIAEKDLQIRGMGNLIGREQSGFPQLRIGNPLRDGEILKQAREEAYSIVDKDPRLEDPAYALLRERARTLYKAVGAYVSVG